MSHHESLSYNTNTNESSTVHWSLPEAIICTMTLTLSHYEVALEKGETIQLTLLAKVTDLLRWLCPSLEWISESALKTNNFRHCQVISRCCTKANHNVFWTFEFILFFPKTEKKVVDWFWRFLWSAKSPSVQQVSSYLNCHELACTLSPAKPRRKQPVRVQMH